MKITFLTFLTLVICLGCNTELPEERLYPNGKTIIKRIKPPEGYNWIIEESGSFGEFLQHIEVEPAGTKILDYQKKPISNQSEHAAVLKKEIGNKDLQQCADAVIRLRADYLWEKINMTK